MTMIETATVGAKGLTAKGGEISWSGTIMKAKLAADAGVDTLPAGSDVEITDIEGITLIVKPKT